MIIVEKLGNVKNLEIIYSGSGNPAEQHTVIGIKYQSADGQCRGIQFTDAEISGITPDVIEDFSGK
jgi:hypothetical protein